jgi:hypothetical protein
MSSATSIKGTFRLKGEATKAKSRAAETVTPPPDGAAHEDAGFRPWHFFLLASLVTATAAVMMSRRSTPEHLVLISLTIIAAGLAAAGFYRMLVPLAAPDLAMFTEPLSQRARRALEREKMLVLRSIKELEFDRAMGKLSQKDFDEMSVRLRTRAMALMKQLDAGGGGYREVIERDLRARLGAAGKQEGQPSRGFDVPERARSAVCAGCGTANDQDASFCKRCGAKL